MGKKMTTDANNKLGSATAVVEGRQNYLSNELKGSLPPVIARVDFEKYFGKLISRGRLANLDSEGRGPKSFKLGRKTAYTRDSIIEWILSFNEGDAA